MKAFSKPYRVSNWTVILLVILIAGGAVALRLVGISDRVFWYDELQSLTHATQGLPDLLFSVRLFDPHPPLYYMQLHLWTLFSTDITWVRLNSVLWSLATLPPLFLIGRNLYGLKSGLFAIALFAVAPLAVHYAQEVRQYAMLMCLVVWSIFFLERAISQPKNPYNAIFLTTSLLALVYSHGTGFLILPAIVSYSLLTLGGDLFSKERRALLIAGLVAISLTLPWLIKAKGTTLGHLAIPDAARLLEDVTILLFGPEQSVPMWIALSCGACLLLLVNFAPGTRNLAVSFIILPASIVLALSALVTPVWHIRTILPFLPILFLVLGGALTNLGGHRLSDGVLVSVVAVLMALALLPYSLAVNNVSPARRTHFDLAEYIQEELPRGTTVAFQSNRDAWGVIWYLAGPGAVQTLRDRQIIKTEAGLQILYLRDARNRVAGDDPTFLVVRDGHPDAVYGIARFGNMSVVATER